MIVKGIILFWIKNLQQGRRWIASEIHTHFINFIQAEYRIIDLDLLQ